MMTLILILVALIIMLASAIYVLILVKNEMRVLRAENEALKNIQPSEEVEGLKRTISFEQSKNRILENKIERLEQSPVPEGSVERSRDSKGRFTNKKRK